MRKLILASLLIVSTSAFAMGPDYKQMPNGGYSYTGGAHLKGCSNQFQVGKTTKQFVIECMKIDGISVRKPDHRRSITNYNGVREIIGFGKTTFYFQNGILDSILN